MLRIFADEINMCKISKLLGKYPLKATIQDSSIIIDGKIPEELANQLYTNVQITGFDNSVDVQNEKAIFPATRYFDVKRGEVYLCDFGEPFEHEQAGKRYAIIVQNDESNKFSLNTIVIPCTTQLKGNFPFNLTFKFSSENMVDYTNSKVSSKVNVALGESIRCISKSRLVQYLGSMTQEFMDQKIQPIIEYSLALKRNMKPKFSSIKTEASKKNPDIVPTLSLEQMQLLSFVDINELLSISKSSIPNNEKAHKILQLFGFDFNQNGVSLLLDAIMICPKSERFNLQMLCQKLSETGIYSVDSGEMQRLIVARIKERFRLKNSPAIDFIRLVNCLISKEGK